MKANFAVHSVEHGSPWKHGHLRRFPLIRDDQIVRLLICVKNPYAWLDSFYRWCSRHVKVGGIFGDPGLRACRFAPGYSFADFLSRPCYDHDTPVEHWNAMHRSWMALTPDARLLQVVHAENLYAGESQRITLRRIQAAFGLRQLQDTLRIQTKRVGVNARVIDKTMNADFYSSHRYMARFQPELLAFVSERLDGSVLEALGYSRHPKQLC